MLLSPVKLKTAVPTYESRSNGLSGRIWYVWLDNVDQRTLTCLPYQKIGKDDCFGLDLQTFAYDDVECLPEVFDVVFRAAHTTQGLIEVAEPLPEAEAVGAACAAGLLEMVGNGVAQITPAGRRVAERD